MNSPFLAIPPIQSAGGTKARLENESNESGNKIKKPITIFYGNCSEHQLDENGSDTQDILVAPAESRSRMTDNQSVE